MLRLLALLVAAFAATPVAAASFAIAAGEPNRVVFESKAPTETFTGKTRGISGTVNLDPAALGATMEVRVEVDMASFDTGIGLRNKHMTENHLHTDKYPKAVFTGGTLSDLSATALAEGQPVTGKITGHLELHGVTKPLVADITLARVTDGVHVVAKFPVTLADFAIPRPQMLVMKLGETQKVTVDVVARSN
jgi:polyisoprenoid-binding protein YceI